MTHESLFDGAYPTHPTPEVPSQSRRGPLARLIAVHLTPARIATVDAAIEAFDPDSYAVLIEL